ncbi:condensation domain-containing protein [Lolliginicoccus suaedae]|uniref:condensation domain-containing protein n=1 Tax=Lolliginicoccus suaedae TaxID=2605429 RepID=UPI001659D460|nr:condensation domain-containing protein [Lolliginicoccus suaedae]
MDDAPHGQAGRAAERRRPAPSRATSASDFHRCRPSRIPLSPAEQRLWLINRFDPRTDAHNVPISIDLTGDLDQRALGAATADLLERHEILRTRFPVSAEGPHQEIMPASAVPIDIAPVHVPAHVDPPVLIEDFAATGFDLTVEPPFRVRLFQLAADEYILTIVVHHIAVDRASLRQLIADLFQAYEARCARRKPDWSELPVQYADYALWQRELLGEESDPDSVTAREIEFWRAELADAPELLDLPLDRPRPEYQLQRGRAIEFFVGDAAHAGLRRIADEQQVSVFTVLQGALTLLLSRLCGTDDVTIGTTVEARADESLAPIVGMFGNTLALRNRVVSTETVAQFLRQVHARGTDAFAHPETPFERLVDVLDIKRTTSYHPVFQVAMSMHSDDAYAASVGGIDISIGSMQASSADCDLELVLTEHTDADGGPAGIAGSMVYAIDLFEESTVVAIVQRFQRLLTAIVDDIDTPIRDIDVLTDKERGLLLPRRTLVHRSLDQALRTTSRRLAALTSSPLARRAESSYDEVMGKVSGAASKIAPAASGNELALALLSYATGKMDPAAAQRLADTMTRSREASTETREITA